MPPHANRVSRGDCSVILAQWRNAKHAKPILREFWGQWSLELPFILRDFGSSWIYLRLINVDPLTALHANNNRLLGSHKAI